MSEAVCHRRWSHDDQSLEAPTQSANVLHTTGRRRPQAHTDRPRPQRLSIHGVASAHHHSVIAAVGQYRLTIPALPNSTIASAGDSSQRVVARDANPVGQQRDCHGEDAVADTCDARQIRLASHAHIVAERGQPQSQTERLLLGADSATVYVRYGSCTGAANARLIGGCVVHI